MFQAIHCIGQGKKIGENREREGHGRHWKEDSAEKDHGEAKEIGHSHRLEDLFHSHRNEDAKEGKGKSRKDDDKNKRK